MWATLKGIANSGQHMEMAEQVPDTSPVFKNQFYVVVIRWGTCQVLSWGRSRLQS